MVINPGKFGYLGHIYPLDASYHSPFSRFLLDLGLALTADAPADAGGDLLGSMIRNIKHYDIVPYELRNLRVVLVAVHTKGFATVVDRLVEAGLFLSQIKILYDPKKTYTNISLDVGSNRVLVEWVGKDGRDRRWTGIEGIADLGQMVKSISGYSG